MGTQDLMAQCCWNLQQSHLCLAKNDLVLAKKYCVLASTAINEALRNKTDHTTTTIAEIAQFTIFFYKKLLKNGLATLLAQEKLQWLASANSDKHWFPILEFGKIKSTLIAPMQLVDDESLRLPKFSLDFCAKFDETVSRPSVERQISALSIDNNNQNSRLGTLALTDLFQDLLTNCSFVLSLLSITELGMELDLRELVTFHGNSRAKVELFFNGSKREISITTRLPFVLPPHESRSLHVRSLSSNTITWPAILEKAFLIALGEDYTFSGSNMAHDTYILIGWIPEVKRTSESSISEISAYYKLKELGLVALGLGTGPMSTKLAKQLEVVPEHDYVLSHYDDDEKVLFLRNPWTAENLAEKSMQLQLRVDLSLLGQFSYLYLNWNPAPFKSKRVTFPSLPLKWPEIYLADKPQYVFTNESDKEQEVVVLVEKYFRTKGDMCVSVWEGSKNLIYTTTQYPLVDGEVFVDSRLQSLTFNAQPGKDYIVSVSLHDEKPAIYSFALFYKMDNLLFKKAKSKFPRGNSCLTGRWYGSSRGGNWACETYVNNPQYDLKITDPNVSISIVLASKNPNIGIAVHLFHCEESLVGKKIKKFDRSKLLVNESYSKLICLLQVSNMDPGIYRIVASAFDCQGNDEYQIVLAHDSERELTLETIPQALGTFEQALIFEWQGRNRIKYTLRSDYHKTKAVFHILSGSKEQSCGTYVPALRASLFDLLTEDPVILTSEWNNSLYGVFLDCEIPESSRDYILLIERFEPGDGVCRLKVGSNSRLAMKEYLN